MALLEYEGIRNSIHDTIIQTVIDLSDTTEDVVLMPIARKKIVDKAREYIVSRTNVAPTILELCDVLGTSRRKLQYCFQETLGINPTSYLRTVRLNAVHRELSDATEEVAVQDIASDWGFMHLSRFANDYKTLFSELPSETLRCKQM
ncbi:helix-turn-helix domain-containing protein [Marinomonas mediterranea]|uniref:helix-turn-helix domain-containing protein n=1 Tax=Marinomonas mediterranea TaxID=119864 RepID=UPI0002FCCD8E|nr:helix-turn-helix domain-containing protein [Marinomonas mediterranea]WCN16619.1 helix-turn-helix domain-containing protein [Marinomonas mediterranea MMB-1]